MKLHLLLLLIMLTSPALSQMPTEINARVSVEAEHFIYQEKNEIRKWYLIDKQTSSLLKDIDSIQCSGAGGNAFNAVLPDNRKTHDDKLIPNHNFSNEPGKMAIVSYSIQFTNPGKYYVWVRAYSTGTEDNGVHAGLNGEWPGSGQRMQWCEGKDQWTWGSRQRTEANHCGEEKLIFLDIPSPGKHTISFSMREDGFRFDKFILSKTWQIPEE